MREAGPGGGAVLGGAAGGFMVPKAAFPNCDCVAFSGQLLT